MKVLKFGGSSVAKPERIRGIVDILKGYYTKGEKFTVVFSAFGGVTDSLIEMSTLAAKGDEAYQAAFDAFRHSQQGNNLPKSSSGSIHTALSDFDGFMCGIEEGIVEMSEEEYDFALELYGILFH